MNTVSFAVLGSSLEPYRVTFERDGSLLRAFCTCAAGENGQYCKHRLNILMGAPEGVVSDNSSDVATVASWLEGSQLASALQALHDAEQNLDQAKQRISRAKKGVAAAMHGRGQENSPC